MIESQEAMRAARQRLLRRRSNASVHPGTFLQSEKLPLAVLAGIAGVALAANMLLRLLPLQ